MYTQCPECLTIFRIGAADLAVARGSARCSHCNKLFDALRNLADELPPEPIHSLVVHPVLPLPPQLGAPVYRPNLMQANLPFDMSQEKAVHRRETLPAFTRRRRARASRASNRGWIAGSAALLLVLAVQMSWAERALWVNDPTVRPWVDRACAKLGCALPLRRDLGALTLASREVRPHPTVGDALVISATVRNDASFAQAWPVIDVTLSDLDDNRIAMRRFRPSEYLDGSISPSAGIEAGSSAALVFEVADPGQDAVAFEFRFE